jgi:hypothetical protein
MPSAGKTCSASYLIHAVFFSWSILPAWRCRRDVPTKRRLIFKWLLIRMGACGSVVGSGTMLQAGRTRDRVPMRWIFSIDLIFQPHYGPRVDSASNRNKYQESSWRVKGGWDVRLTTSTPSWADCLENVGASTSHKTMGLHGLLQG